MEAFQAPLAAYGTWSTVRGVRAWQPSAALVGQDFVPYGTGGQWVSTRAGWVFESSYPFGWATYHYGRWWYEEGFGWVWMPDTVWGPSWVDWRFGGGYTGWAPLPPLWLSSWHRPHWFFVETHRFCGREPWRYRVAPGVFSVAWSATQPLPPRRWGHVSWYSGPKWGQVAKFATETPVRRPISRYYPPHGAVPVNAYRPVGATAPKGMPQPGYPVPAPQAPKHQPAAGYQPVPREVPRAYPGPQATPRAYAPPPAPMPQAVPRTYAPPPGAAPQALSPRDALGQRCPRAVRAGRA